MKLPVPTVKNWPQGKEASDQLSPKAFKFSLRTFGRRVYSRGKMQLGKELATVICNVTVKDNTFLAKGSQPCYNMWYPDILNSLCYNGRQSIMLKTLFTCELAPRFKWLEYRVNKYYPSVLFLVSADIHFLIASTCLLYFSDTILAPFGPYFFRTFLCSFSKCFPAFLMTFFKSTLWCLNFGCCT